ncbi:MAG: OmcA/MtrC family decaheme c-type cytochrome [Acidobacteriota bacterium]
MINTCEFRRWLLPAVLLLAIVSVATPGWANSGGDPLTAGTYTKHQLGYYLDPNEVAFVRPGLKFAIKNVTIGADLKLRVTFSITDDRGLPLDRNGVVTPGAVTTSFVAAYIPKGQSQYVAYTTRPQTSPITGVTATQASSDSGGSYQQVSEGVYTYTFGRALPSNYDGSVTHTIHLYGRRDLTEFELGRQVHNVEFSWVPNGGEVTVVRDVVRTETCNKCHDPLALHGGQRVNVSGCVTCHTPQTVDPDTGNTVDLKVMVHKIHNGPNLPSVQAGKPYQIIGFGQSVHDYSHVTYPQDVRNCEACHDGSASQAMNWLTKPTRATCGSCHDSVNFATGEGHVGGPQISDNLCTGCHLPEGELEFDASIKGAHTIPSFSRDLPGVNFEILEVKNTQPGQKPEVSFKITDKEGFPIETSQMNFLNVVIAGPNDDYAAYWSESALRTSSSGGVVTYTFTRGIPEDAKGSYTVGIEGYRTMTLQPGTTKEITNVRDVGFNKMVSVPVTDTTAKARRMVISQENCNQCHGSIALHGTIRRNVQYCLMCHNPNMDDAAVRPQDKLPTESIHMKTMIHKIHRGEGLESELTIYGFRSSVHNYNEVVYPGDLRNCEKCHVADTQQLPLPKGVLPSLAPRDFLNPMAPVTAACLSCHTSQEAASHALLNTSTLGEACRVCHGPTSQVSVDKAHAR